MHSGLKSPLCYWLLFFVYFGLLLFLPVTMVILVPKPISTAA